MALHENASNEISVPPKTAGTPIQCTFTAKNGTIVVIDVNAFNNPIESVTLVRADGSAEKLT